jgi:hypothetical protein
MVFWEREVDISQHLRQGHQTETDNGFELAYGGFTAPQQTTTRYVHLIATMSLSESILVKLTKRHDVRSETHYRRANAVHLSSGTTIPARLLEVTNASVEGSSSCKTARLFGVEE